VDSDTDPSGVVWIEQGANNISWCAQIQDSADMKSITENQPVIRLKADNGDERWYYLAAYTAYFDSQLLDVEQNVDGKKLAVYGVAKQITKIPGYNVINMGFVVKTDTRTTTTSTNSCFMSAWKSQLYTPGYTGIQREAMDRLHELKQLFERAEVMGVKLSEVVERKRQPPKLQLSLDVDDGPSDKKTPRKEDAKVDIREEKHGGVARFGQHVEYYVPQHSQGLVQQVGQAGNVRRGQDGDDSDGELVVLQRPQRVSDLSEREDERQSNPGISGGVPKHDGVGIGRVSATPPPVRVSSKK